MDGETYMIAVMEALHCTSKPPMQVRPHVLRCPGLSCVCAGHPGFTVSAPFLVNGSCFPRPDASNRDDIHHEGARSHQRPRRLPLLISHGAPDPAVDSYGHVRQERGEQVVGADSGKAIRVELRHIGSGAPDIHRHQNHACDDESVDYRRCSVQQEDKDQTEDSADGCGGGDVRVREHRRTDYEHHA